MATLADGRIVLAGLTGDFMGVVEYVCNTSIDPEEYAKRIEELTTKGEIKDFIQGLLRDMLVVIDNHKEEVINEG